MAIYHLSAKAMRRKDGRSATAAAAYRAGEKIVDERTGAEFDYSRKKGVLGAELCMPGGGTEDRAEFWNRVEKHHRRGDAVVAREVEVSLPAELTNAQRRELALTFARELVARYGVAIDVALHAPRPVTDRDLERNPDQFHMTDPETGERHNGNWHAHLLMSACHVQPDGTLGKKAVELDPIHCQRHQIENMTDRERGRWADLQNAALETARLDTRVDHRSYADRGIEQLPTIHLGGHAARMRRNGTPEHTERSTLNLEIRAKNRELHQMQERAALRAAERDARLEPDDLDELKHGDMLAAVDAAVNREAAEAIAEIELERADDARVVRDAQKTLDDMDALEAAGDGLLREMQMRRQARALADAPQASKPSPQPTPSPTALAPKERALADAQALLSIQSQVERAGIIRDAVTSLDDDYADAFEDALVELKIGAHGELPEASSQERQEAPQRDAWSRDEPDQGWPSLGM